MLSDRSRKDRCFLLPIRVAWFGSAILLLCGSVAGFAQDVTTSSAPPQIQFQVLQRWKAQAGDHSIYFNLVVPPILPVASAQPAPSAPAASGDSQATEKKFVSVFMTATVYDHQITAVTVNQENGSFKAYSDLDFTYLAGVQTCETDDSTYSFFLVVDNQDSSALDPNSPQATELAQARSVLPALQNMPAGTASQYGAAAGTAAANPDAIAALDVLHAYYDVASAQLIQRYQQRVAAAAQAALEASQNPPVPKDTIINFWPIKSTLFPNGVQGGASK